MAGEIFISYRRADQAKARLLHALLKQRGVDAWYDALVGAGQDWRHRTAEALAAAPIFVLLFSKVASESDDISKELAAATFSKKLVIPVRIDDIQPAGAFLYELASRNWFDAFKDTEKRFEELADKLAALVKGGPEAEVAAFSLVAPAVPAVKPAAKPWFKNPLMLGGIALAAVALVAAIAFYVTRGPSAGAAPLNERTAFFGFTAADADRLSTQVAGVATDETFSTLTSLGLETAARGETQGVEPKDQMDKAAKVGARYALSGGVRATGDEVAVTMRLDDVQTRATIWQEKQSGGRDLAVALPVQAAAHVTNMLDCLINIRPGIVREDARALGIIARACDNTYFGADAVTRWREAVRVAPKSAAAEFSLGVAWVLQSSSASTDDRRMMLEQARQALAAAEAIEPGRIDVRAANDLIDLASDRPLADIIKDLNALLGVGVDRSKRQRISGAVFARLGLLSTVGRPAEAARLSSADIGADRLNAGLQMSYALDLSLTGQTEEARHLYQSVISRFADPGSWIELAYLTIFERGDFAPVMEAAPPGVRRELKDCLQDVARATRLPANARKAGVRRVLECVKVDAPQIDAAALVLANFGGEEGVDAAFDLFEHKILDRSNPISFGPAGARLFGPYAKIMRAHPRFLQLMKTGGKLGIYQYWLDTKTQPEVCEMPDERDLEVCVALRKDQGK